MLIWLDCQILYYSRFCERENNRGHWIQQIFLLCFVPDNSLLPDGEDAAAADGADDKAPTLCQVLCYTLPYALLCTISFNP